MKRNVCCALIDIIDAFIAKQDEDIADDLEQAGYEDTEWTKEQMQDLEENLAAAMNVDTEIVAEQLENSDSLDDFIYNVWEAYQDASALADDIQEVIADGLSKTLPRLVSDYLQKTDTGLVATVLRARTVGWAATWSEELGRVMKLNSHQKIGSILVDALTNGKSVAQATQEIIDSGIRDNYARARQTALTEMLTAHSVAAEEAIQQSPAVEGKEWRHTGSRRNKPRKNHVAMDGQVVPKTEPFDLTGADGGSYKPMHPRDTSLPPGERINCHCIHRGIVSADILGLPLEERKKLQQEAVNSDDRKWAVEQDEQNKAASGNQTYGKPVNSLLPNGNGGILDPTRTTTQRSQPIVDAANAIVDQITKNGGIARYFYDEAGKVMLRIDNNDHGFPKKHRFGNGGAHYTRAKYDSDGNFTGWGDNRCLTAKMRRLCRSILKEYPDMILKEGSSVLDIDAFIEAIDVNHSELYLEYNGNTYIVSESMGHGPADEPISLTGPDEQQFAWDANGVLNLLLDGKPIRSLVDEIKWL